VSKPPKGISIDLGRESARKLLLSKPLSAITLTSVRSTTINSAHLLVGQPIDLDLVTNYQSAPIS
jgi:hypothetical protein